MLQATYEAPHDRPATSELTGKEQAMAPFQLSRRSLTAIELALAAGLSAADHTDADASPAVSGAALTPLAQFELPPGVEIEHIADTPDIAMRGARRFSVSVARWRLSPQARIDPPSDGPTMLLVESGEMTLEAVGARVSANYPKEESISGNDEIRVRGVAVAPAAGVRLLLPKTGSAFTDDGAIGPIRNGAGEDLSLLVVSIVPEAPSAEMTVVPVPTPPEP